MRKEKDTMKMVIIMTAMKMSKSAAKPPTKKKIGE
jgi:hypothetical protein